MYYLDSSKQSEALTLACDLDPSLSGVSVVVSTANHVFCLIRMFVYFQAYNFYRIFVIKAELCSDFCCNNLLFE